jgi:hypothetical protein
MKRVKPWRWVSREKELEVATTPYIGIMESSCYQVVLYVSGRR